MKTSFVDLHNDAITCFSSKGFSKYIARAGKLGVATVLISVWTTEIKNPLQRIQEFRQFIDSINTSVKLLLHIEDAWFVDEQNVYELLECRPFSIGLTWNKDNKLAGGALDNGGLTDLGKFLIRRFVESNVIVDLAHLNKISFYEVAGLLCESGRRLFCSHTCFDEINSHPRNLDHGQIQTIVDSGGLVGLTLVGDFLCAGKRAQMLDIYNHIAYFIENFGDDNLAVGTDFFGTAELPEKLNGYSGLVRFRRFLVAEGISDSTVDKIFYINAKRFFDSYNSI